MQNLGGTIRVGKSNIFVNPDFLGLQIWQKKRVNYKNLKLRQHFVNHKLGKNLVKFNRNLGKFDKFGKFCKLGLN